MLILVLSTALITISIPTSMAIGTDEIGNPYGFTGESQFGEADDLIFLRARYYSPSTGRFISRDPILVPDIFDSTFQLWLSPVSKVQLAHKRSLVNLYTYVRNNPVNKADKTGLWTSDDCIKTCGDIYALDTSICTLKVYALCMTIWQWPKCMTEARLKLDKCTLRCMKI